MTDRQIRKRLKLFKTLLALANAVDNIYKRVFVTLQRPARSAFHVFRQTPNGVVTDFLLLIRYHTDETVPVFFTISHTTGDSTGDNVVLILCKGSM